MHAAGMTFDEAKLAHLEDALAYYFAAALDYPINSVRFVRWHEDHEQIAVVDISWRYIGPTPTPTRELLEPIEWIWTVGIGERAVDVDELYEVLDVEASQLGTCDRRGCERAAERFVFWAPIEDVRQNCETHTPACSPFYADHDITGPTPLAQTRPPFE
jgi:hypothetical protein